jgi:hypothetical protein
LAHSIFNEPHWHRREEKTRRTGRVSRAVSADAQEYDWLIEVAAPRRCPHCDGNVTVAATQSKIDHLHEDIVDNTYRVVCY